MDNQHQPPPSAKVLLHPVMTPQRLPGFDIHTMTDDEFRSLMAPLGYKEVWGPTRDRQYEMRGLYAAHGGEKNVCYMRMSVSGTDGTEYGHMDFTEASCVMVAGHLLEYAVGLSNMNGTPEVISEQLMELIGRFLHPETFSKMKAALMIAAEEELKAKLRVHELAKNKA